MLNQITFKLNCRLSWFDSYQLTHHKRYAFESSLLFYFPKTTRWHDEAHRPLTSLRRVFGVSSDSTGSRDVLSTQRLISCLFKNLSLLFIATLERINTQADWSDSCWPAWPNTDGLTVSRWIMRIHRRRRPTVIQGQISSHPVINHI